MLDRVGAETARATTVVRYAEGSKFRRHEHGGGEEFYVLEGTFSDEHGDFPAGCYIRNPPTSGHAPWSDAGCVILVKLHQFDLADRTHVRLDANKMVSLRPRDRDAGVAVKPLFSDGVEDVRLETWDPDAQVRLDALPGGAELFCLEGSFHEGGDDLDPWSWLRLPPGATLDAKAGPAGAKVFVKTGHLPPDLKRYEGLDDTV